MKRPTSVLRAIAALAACLLISSCDSPAAPKTSGAPAFPARMIVLAGDAQSGRVGEELPSALTVRVVSTSGTPIGGQIVNFRVVSGNGRVFGGAAVTDAQGRAAERWTLGTVAGEAQRVEARAVNPETGAAIVFASFDATASPGVVAALVRISADSQSAPAGERVAAPPSVQSRDRYGNPVADVAVAFRVTAGDGSVSDASLRSSATGVATLAHWTLGARTGRNTVTASATDAADVTFVATGRAGAITRIEIVAGDKQTATVGKVLAISPAITLRDALGNPVPGHAVQFAVASGGGSAAGSSVQTDDNGTAIARWTLGTLVGANSLRVSAGTLAPVTFTANGTADVPSFYSFVSGQGQIEIVNTPLPVVPTVRVVDRYGNRIAGIPVSFTLPGPGTIGVSNGSTDARGEVTPVTWRLGATEGFNVLRANSPGFPQIALLARGVPMSAFPIDIRYIPGTEPPAAIRAMVQAAVARLQKVFVQAPSAVLAVVEANSCATGQPAMTETINGVVVWVEIKSIDGVGGNLGSAAPCYRRSISKVTLVGHLRLDLDDLARDLADGTALATTIHEFLHILGFAPLWPEMGLLSGSSNDPWFNGKYATEAFQDALSRPYPGFGVPVENLGGPASAMKHWRTSLLGPEMMTAFACGGFAPLSYVTLSAFLDMGLDVTQYGDDDFKVPLSGCPSERRRTGVYEENRATSARFMDERTGAILSAAEALMQSRGLLRAQPAPRAEKPVVVEGARRNP